MNQRLTITCNGKHLDMASSFMLFLMNRKGAQFYYGQWLLTLSKYQLDRMYELGEEAIAGDVDSYTHLLQIAVIAIAAELRTAHVITKPNIVDDLHWLTTLELSRRHGLVNIATISRLSEVEQLQNTLSELATKAVSHECKDATFH